MAGKLAIDGRLWTSVSAGSIPAHATARLNTYQNLLY